MKSIFTFLLLYLTISESAAQDTIFPYGVSYYPEHWSTERIEKDAQLMQEAGVNCVRMSEFGWSVIEPVEGQYEFELFDNAIEILAKHGIKTIFATCSRTPPPWVFTKYPEIINYPGIGKSENYGKRYTVNLNHPKFIELSQRIDMEVIKHFGGNPNIIGWQIDNEIGAGNEDFSEHSKSEFQLYLKNKYKSVEKLNDKWGAHFWSFAFNDFSEIPLPSEETGNFVATHPSLKLEWNRFNSMVNSNFAQWRFKQLKQFSPGRWITTNFQHSRATHTDIFELGEATDIYGTNFYPPAAHEFGLDYCRGSRGELLVLEQRSGQPLWSGHTKPGFMRLWAWNSVAHGANGIVFFRWRPALFGQEQYWHGVLPHSGTPNRRYDELKLMGEEINKVGDLVRNTKPAANVAIVMDYQSRWALNSVLPKDNLHIEKEAYLWHESLMANHVTTDALDPKENLMKYQLVIAPRLYLVNPEVAKNLQDYVANGGILVLTFRSGVVNEFNKIFEASAPGPFAEMAGIRVDDYGSLNEQVPLDFNNEYNLNNFHASDWADEIILDKASPVALYNHGWLAGKPAITINNFGKGQVVYIGTSVQRPGLDDLAGWLLNLAEIPNDRTISEEIRILKRENDKYELLFILNFSDETHEIKLKNPMLDVFSDSIKSSVTVPPLELTILKRDKE